MLDVDRQTLRLYAGELTPDEMRAVQAVLAWKRREMLARAEGRVASELPPRDAGGETA